MEKSEKSIANIEMIITIINSNPAVAEARAERDELKAQFEGKELTSEQLSQSFDASLKASGAVYAVIDELLAGGFEMTEHEKRIACHCSFTPKFHDALKAYEGSEAPSFGDINEIHNELTAPKEPIVEVPNIPVEAAAKAK